MTEEKIIAKFLSINESSNNPTNGKYSSKNNSFYNDIKEWQDLKLDNKYSIRPIQFTFEITNKCNCNCKDCGMAANRMEVERTSIEETELKTLVDSLERMGIPAFAITGGEPFLEFDKICSMIEYAKNKVDVIKIISNGFWGIDAKHYFQALEQSGFFENNFFVPSLQISIGEQTVPLEYICNIISYVTNHYQNNELHLGIIHTREPNLKESKLVKLYKTYIEKFGSFPENRVFLTESNYVNSNPLATEKIAVETTKVYDMLPNCSNRFTQKIGTFVSPKIFMKCNGDCYPCEVFNIHECMYLGNYFKDGLDTILENYNNNKYISFIRDYGTSGFRDVIPKKILEQVQVETVCQACEYCIKYAEEKRLIR